jgi:hypothetical protein
MNDEVKEIQHVAEILKQWEKAIEALINSRSIENFDRLKQNVALLKADIKSKNLENSKQRQNLSEAQRIYFATAIQDASSHFTMKANLSPSNPDWTSGLQEVARAFSYQLWRLRKANPTIDLPAIRQS